MKTTTLFRLACAGCLVSGGLLATGLPAQTDPNPITLPVVNLHAVDPVAAETGATGTPNLGVFRISRSHGTNALPVYYHIGGTAENGVDYVRITNVVVIPPNALAVDIIIRPIDDNVPEPTETVELTLSPVACITIYPPPPHCYLVGPRSNAVVWIEDNDRPPEPISVSVVASDPDAAEPGILTVMESGEFTIRRSHGTNIALPVYFTLSGTATLGEDYVAVAANGVLVSNQVIIPVGALTTTVQIYPRHDDLPEPTETVVLTIQPPVCIAIYPPPPECYVVGLPERAVVYIRDNDTPPPNRPPVVRLVAPTNGAVFVAPVDIRMDARAEDPDDAVVAVDFFAGDHFVGRVPGTNLPLYSVVWSNALPGFYLLTAQAVDSRGAMGTSAPVKIAVLGTNVPPPPRPPVVTIEAVDPVAAEGTNCWRWYTNELAVNVAVTAFGGRNPAVFVVRRSGSTNESLTVEYWIRGSAVNGVDYATIPDRITIPAGQRAARIVIEPIDDTLPECTETVILRLRPQTNLPPAYIVGWPSRAAAIIVDNDRPRPVTSLLCDRAVHVAFPGQAGQCYRLEISEDLQNWIPVGTSRATDLTVHFTDPDAPEFSPRFYRVVPVPCPPAE